jgi:cell division transport system ATP-binding protein
MILAEEKPTHGKISFNSSQIHKLKGNKLVDFRRKIGMVFQDFRLLTNRTVYENIAFAMEASGKSDEEIRKDVPHVLDLVDLGSKISHFPDQLSGGEKQRVAIARALVNRPEIIIADEPTGNLDPVNTYDIIQILKKINDLGTTVILTTHNKGIIDHLKKRVITMEDGKIVKDENVNGLNKERLYEPGPERMSDFVLSNLNNLEVVQIQSLAKEIFRQINEGVTK